MVLWSNALIGSQRGVLIYLRMEWCSWHLLVLKLQSSWTIVVKIQNTMLKTMKNQEKVLTYYAHGVLKSYLRRHQSPTFTKEAYT